MTLTWVLLAAAVWLSTLRPPTVRHTRDSEPERSSTVRTLLPGRPGRHRAGVPTEELDWLPLVLDLVSAGLVAGQPLEVALAAAAPAHAPRLDERLRHVAGLLRLGAEPAQAWARARR